MSSLDVAEHAVGADEVITTGRAMATRICVRVHGSCTPAQQERRAVAAQNALAVFDEVDRTCTRFAPTSALMRANRSPAEWHDVPPTLLNALREAKYAHDATNGRFDPRILRQLVALGYDRTLAFESGEVETPAACVQPRREHPSKWQPGFRTAVGQVRIGPDPVDLGGIGKGLAVRWASNVLVRVAPDHLIDAGGDVYAAGRGPDGDLWRVAIEDPASAGDPLAVLALRDMAATTSSVRLRRWRARGEWVHHLIDPATGLPGGHGLLAVTVVGKDPARAEVWSKSLFVAGVDRIGAIAARRGIPALWVKADGRWIVSDAMRPFLRWTRG